MCHMCVDSWSGFGACSKSNILCVALIETCGGLMLPDAVLLSGVRSKCVYFQYQPFGATPRKRQGVHSQYLQHPPRRRLGLCKCRGRDSRTVLGQCVVAMAVAQLETGNLPQTNPEIVIVTTIGCQFCKRAKDRLHQTGLQYQEIEASSQLQLLSKIKDITGRRTVPQVTLWKLEQLFVCVQHC